jgi:hypothetical protein
VTSAPPISTPWLVANGIAAASGALVTARLVGHVGNVAALAVGLPVGAAVVGILMLAEHLRPVLMEILHARVPAQWLAPEPTRASGAGASTVVGAPPLPNEATPTDDTINWWQGGRRSLPRPSRAGADEIDLSPVAPVDVEAFVPLGPLGRQPQCPCCGDFDPTDTVEGRGHRFVCRRCHHMWRWAIGDPWPRVQLDPLALRPQPDTYPKTTT